MNYIILIIVGVLGIIAGIYFGRAKRAGKKISKRATLALLLMVAGIILGQSRPIAYTFFGAGLALAIFDIVKKKKGA